MHVTLISNMDLEINPSIVMAAADTLTHRGQESSRQRIKRQQSEAQRSEWELQERKGTEGELLSP